WLTEAVLNQELLARQKCAGLAFRRIAQKAPNRLAQFDGATLAERANTGVFDHTRAHERSLLLCAEQKDALAAHFGGGLLDQLRDRLVAAFGREAIELVERHEVHQTGLRGRAGAIINELPEDCRHNEALQRWHAGQRRKINDRWIARVACCDSQWIAV